MNSLVYVIRVEVHEQTNVLVCYAEIGDQLFVVYRLEFFYRLEFYNHSIFHENIKTEVYWQYMTIIDNVNLNLFFHMQSLLPQFVAQSSLVDRLQETWTKRLVHMEYGTAYFICQLALCHNWCSHRCYFNLPRMNYFSFPQNSQTTQKACAVTGISQKNSVDSVRSVGE